MNVRVQPGNRTKITGPHWKHTDDVDTLVLPLMVPTYFTVRLIHVKYLLAHFKDNVEVPWWLSGKEFACNAGNAVDTGLIPGFGRYRGEGLQHTPVLLPGESHGQRCLAGNSP